MRLVGILSIDLGRVDQSVSLLIPYPYVFPNGFSHAEQRVVLAEVQLHFSVISNSNISGGLSLLPNGVKVVLSRRSAEGYDDVGSGVDDSGEVGDAGGERRRQQGQRSDERKGDMYDGGGVEDDVRVDKGVDKLHVDEGEVDVTRAGIRRRRDDDGTVDEDIEVRKDKLHIDVGGNGAEETAPEQAWTRGTNKRRGRKAWTTGVDNRLGRSKESDMDFDVDVVDAEEPAQSMMERMQGGCGKPSGVLAPAVVLRLPFLGNSLRSLTVPDLPRFRSLIAGLQSFSRTEQKDDRT
ncbi:hypothetical protein BDD12DRAFT_891344 [Trichophaea hybrida]|nr:hypothetical protein BDD12DRAFT_891344 [Trichophaea hybrida]